MEEAKKADEEAKQMDRRNRGIDEARVKSTQLACARDMPEAKLNKAREARPPNESEARNVRKRQGRRPRGQQ